MPDDEQEQPGPCRLVPPIVANSWQGTLSCPKADGVLLDSLEANPSSARPKPAARRARRVQTMVVSKPASSARAPASNPADEKPSKSGVDAKVIERPVKSIDELSKEASLNVLP